MFEYIDLDPAKKILQNTYMDLVNGAIKNKDKPREVPMSATEIKELADKRRIGRNDLCPCGSGKKYKRCCGNF